MPCATVVASGTGKVDVIGTACGLVEVPNAGVLTAVDILADTVLVAVDDEDVETPGVEPIVGFGTVRRTIVCVQGPV